MNGKRMILILTALTVIFSLSAFVNPGGGGNVGDTAPRTITVTGSGKSYLTPDIATISIGVHSEDVDVVTALNDNTAKVQAVHTALTEFGVATNDIQTTNFSVYPSQQYGAMGEFVGMKYMVDNSVTITVRDLSKFGQILSSVIPKGANNIYGINFDASDRTKAMADAQDAAIKNARAQADEVAEAAGVKVGKVITISKSSSQPVPMYDGYGRGGGGMAEAAPAPISSGQLLVSVDVYITYEMQ